MVLGLFFTFFCRIGQFFNFFLSKKIFFSSKKFFFTKKIFFYQKIFFTRKMKICPTFWNRKPEEKLKTGTRTEILKTGYDNPNHN